MLDIHKEALPPPQKISINKTKRDFSWEGSGKVQQLYPAFGYV